VAVNVHHHRRQIEAHFASRDVHISVEEPEPLGTAGALGRLRDWIDMRPALVTNADAWMRVDLASFVDGWDGERTRLLCARDPVRPDFPDGLRYAGTCLLPWNLIATLRDEPSGLYEVAWRDDPGLDLLVHEGPFFDCGTPADYLGANLAANDGQSVVGPGAVVEGELIRSVVWPDGVVRRGERIVESIRVGADLTVHAAQGPERPSERGSTA
jgi:NDP-sugar pyrophosphorylase family protein